jgi:hypothetical protein
VQHCGFAFGYRSRASDSVLSDDPGAVTTLVSPLMRGIVSRLRSNMQGRALIGQIRCSPNPCCTLHSLGCATCNNRLHGCFARCVWRLRIQGWPRVSLEHVTTPRTLRNSCELETRLIDGNQSLLQRPRYSCRAAAIPNARVTGGVARLQVQCSTPYVSARDCDAVQTRSC